MKVVPQPVYTLSLFCVIILVLLGISVEFSARDPMFENELEVQSNSSRADFGTDGSESPKEVSFWVQIFKSWAVLETKRCYYDETLLLQEIYVVYESDEEFWADAEISDSEGDCEILDAVRSQFA